MAECLELIAATGSSNIGIVLDSWHWWTARESAGDVRNLTSGQVIACDLNDAPRDIAIDDQSDRRRELPLATGVIDVKAFLEALVSIGFDGPVRAEPFSQKLDEIDDDAAAKATSRSMKRAVSLVESGGI